MSLRFQRILAVTAWCAAACGSELIFAPYNPGSGYYWWTFPSVRGGQDAEVIAASGAGGQWLFVVPTLDLAVVIVASNGAGLDLLYDLLPAMSGHQDLQDFQDLQDLSNRCWDLPLPRGPNLLRGALLCQSAHGRAGAHAPGAGSGNGQLIVGFHHQNIKRAYWTRRTPIPTFAHASNPSTPGLNVANTEWWQRGPIEGVPTLLQPVAHILLQVRESAGEMVADLTESEWNARPAGVASAAFHVRHIAGVIDRLFTYARGEALSESQLAAIPLEGAHLPAAEASAVLEALSARIDSALNELCGINVATLGDFRGVGRAQLPSTVIGCVVHGAEHAMRHVGQLSVTVRVVRHGTT